MVWLCNTTIKTSCKGNVYVDFGRMFNYSGTDICADSELFFETGISTYTVRKYDVFLNGVRFDVRTLEREILPFRETNSHLFFSYYERENKRKENVNKCLEYGDILVRKSWRARSDCKTSYAYRKDPVPHIHHYHHGGVYRNSKIGNIMRMTHSEEYKEYGRAGRYPKTAWDFEEIRSSYGNKSWKDCTKKRHQWE
jgi:hypothetical protein